MTIPCGVSYHWRCVVKIVIRSIRLFLTVLLLWQVYNHSHWSVALSLTLTFLAFESSSWLVSRNFEEIIDKHNKLVDEYVSADDE